jgi:hypothetical protein
MSLSRVTTLITPAASYDLVDLETVKAELQILNTDTTNDDWLSSAITQVSGAIARYCNRSDATASQASFPEEAVQDLFYPERDPYPYQVPGGEAKLQLSHWPITGVQSVTITDPPGVDTVLVQDTDFVVDAAPGQLIRLDKYMAYPTTWPPIKTIVVYTGGYPDIPADVTVAALRWMVLRYAERGRDPMLRSIEQPLVGTKSYWGGGPGGNRSGGIPQEIAEMLAPYRQPVVA